MLSVALVPRFTKHMLPVGTNAQGARVCFPDRQYRNLILQKHVLGQPWLRSLNGLRVAWPSISKSGDRGIRIVCTHDLGRTPRGHKLLTNVLIGNDYEARKL